MVIVEEPAQGAVQMSCIQDEELIQTLAPDRANQALHIRILLRRTGRDFQLLHSQSLDALSKNSAVNRIAITQEVPRRDQKRKSVDQLLAGPVGGRRLGHGEVENSATVMRQDDEAIEQAEGHRGDDKEIDRDDFFEMVLKEGFPGLPRGSANLGTVLANRGGGDWEAKFGQFIPDARSTPGWVGLPHPTDEFGHLRIDPRPSTFGARSPAPIETKPPFLPTDHSLGSKEQEGVFPTSPMS